MTHPELTTEALSGLISCWEINEGIKLDPAICNISLSPVEARRIAQVLNDDADWAEAHAQR